MKDLVKFFSVITGFFRSVITILFLLGIFFVALVDVNLLVAFLDIIGFSGVSVALIKPLLITLCAIFFIINFIITRHIYKAGETGRYHSSNLFFALIFLILTSFAYISLRNFNSTIFYVLFALNGILFVNSILGIISKSRGEYYVPVVETNPQIESDFIDFGETTSEENIIVDKPVVILNNPVDEKIETEVVKKPVDDVKEVKEVKKETIIKPSQDSKNISDEVSETKVIDKKGIESQNKRVEVEKNKKLVFGPKDDESKKQTVKETIDPQAIDGEIVENTEQKDLKPNAKKVKRVAKKPEPAPNQTNKNVLIERNSTNKVSYSIRNLNENETYGDEHSEQIKRQKDEKVFDKSQFIKESDNIDN